MIPWSRVEQLADRAPTVTDLRFHRLQLVAARRMRERGETVPESLRDDERTAAVASLAAPVLLARARSAYDGAIVVMKGPEIAARYPDPALRPFTDLDLLVDDAPAAHRALLDAGFELTGLWPAHAELYDLHHLQPLRWPGLAIRVEIHERPNFPAGLATPPAHELLATARPSRVGDVPALGAAQHAIVTAAHAWKHAPLAHIGQLVDVALLAAEVDPAQLDALARRWGCERLWRTTRATVDALLLGTPPTAPLRTWARHLPAARERTLLERHIEELCSPLWGLPAAPAARRCAGVLARRIAPDPSETWRRKLHRGARAIRNARLPHSEHEARLPPEDLHIGGMPGVEPAPLAAPRRER